MSDQYKIGHQGCDNFVQRSDPFFHDRQCRYKEVWCTTKSGCENCDYWHHAGGWETCLSREEEIKEIFFAAIKELVLEKEKNTH